MDNIMLDLETMGVSNAAPIMSIGACFFELETGEIGETFHEEVSLETAGGRIDPSTVIWWMKQSDEARSKFYKNEHAKNLQNVLLEFQGFVNDERFAKVWGNGVSFDNVILKNTYETWGLSVPWRHYNERDVRTMVDLGKSIGFNPKESMPFEGVRHDALADAIHQAKYVSAIYRRLVSNAIPKLTVD